MQREWYTHLETDSGQPCSKEAGKCIQISNHYVVYLKPCYMPIIPQLKKKAGKNKKDIQKPYH